jgi:hypothetical protein
VTVSIISPPAEERRQRLEQLLTAPQHTDARRAAHLVAGERDQVGAQGLHVQGHVRRSLRGVDDDQRTDLVGAADELLGRVDRAEDVRHQHERHDLGSLGDDAIDVGQVQPALVGQGRTSAASRPSAARAAATARCWSGAPSP